jgi:Zinc finger, C3HC4 type (RING finger)
VNVYETDIKTMSAVIVPSDCCDRSTRIMKPTKLSRASFVSFDDKYLCVKCREVFRNPRQTPCGHRLCQPCVDDLFNSSSTSSVPCPAAESDCLSITLETVGGCKDIY